MQQSVGRLILEKIFLTKQLREFQKLLIAPRLILSYIANIVDIKGGYRMAENMTVEQIRILQRMIYSKAFNKCEVSQFIVDVSEVKDIIKGATLDDDDYEIITDNIGNALYIDDIDRVLYDVAIVNDKASILKMKYKGGVIDKIRSLLTSFAVKLKLKSAPSITSTLKEIRSLMQPLTNDPFITKFFYPAVWFKCPRNEVIDWVDGKPDKKTELLPDGKFTVTTYVEKEPYILYFVFEVGDTAFVLKLDLKYEYTERKKESA